MMFWKTVAPSSVCEAALLPYHARIAAMMSLETARAASQATMLCKCSANQNSLHRKILQNLNCADGRKSNAFTLLDRQTILAML
jgi:hypothetical protein